HCKTPRACCAVPCRRYFSRRRDMSTRVSSAGLLLLATVMVTGCKELTRPGDDGDRPLDARLVAAGQEIFRHDTYGNEVFWTDTARLHEVIEGGVSPASALQVGLKVDVDALPEAVRQAIVAGTVDLN